MVFYQGEAADNAAFIERYKTVHVALLRKFPNILDVRVHEPVAVDDTHAVSAGGFLLICEMVFASAAHLASALASPQRADARKDFNKFPEFRGQVWHQAMRTEQDHG
jgi:uncharacterized protein (TIGR02118 family)